MHPYYARRHPPHLHLQPNRGVGPGTPDPEVPPLSPPMSVREPIFEDNKDQSVHLIMPRGDADKKFRRCERYLLQVFSLFKALPPEGDLLNTGHP